MKQMGLVFNTKKMIRYFILLLIGFSLVFYGVISFYEDQKKFERSLTDEQVIQRAKELGMVELKEKVEPTEITSEESDEH